MKKVDIDQLYHLLRVASNEPRGNTDMFAFQDLIFGLSRHLLHGGDYHALIQYLYHYGEKYLLNPTVDAIKETGWEFNRVVELGAGLGWLGRGLSSRFRVKGDMLPAVFIDKRQWAMIDIVADMETEPGRKKVLSALKDGDLLVMSELLHCLDNPKEAMAPFTGWPIAILEYCPSDLSYRESYTCQILRYGAKFINPGDYEDIFPGRTIDIVNLDPYLLILVPRLEERK